MKNEQFKGKEREFFKVWWKGYRNHPKTYIDAILNLSVSYWYIYNIPDMAYVSSYYVAMYSRENNWFGNKKIYDKGMTFLRETICMINSINMFMKYIGLLVIRQLLDCSIDLDFIQLVYF